MNKFAKASSTSLIAVLTLSVQLYSPQSLAHCFNEINVKCSAAAGSMVVAGGATYYSIKNFSAAGAMERKNTLTVYDVPTSPKPLDQGLIAKMAAATAEGDVATVEIELSEAESRAVHLNNLQSEISSLDSQAATARANAIEAMRTKEIIETRTDSKGNTTQVKVQKGPDIGEYLRENELAAQYDRQGSELRDRQAGIRNGAPIELVRTDAKINTASESLSEWLHAQGKRGSKLVSMKNLPVTFARQISKLNLKGGVGIAGAVAGTAAAGVLVYSAAQDDKKEAQAAEISRYSRNPGTR